MQGLNGFNLALDGYSAVLCAVLAAYVWITDDRRSMVNRCFVGICVANVVMTLGDMASWLWRPPLGSARYGVLMAGTFLFWIMPAPMFLCFTGYIVAYLRGRTSVPKGYLRFSAALFAVYAAGCVASLFNGMFFHVTPEAGYARGEFFLLGQVVPVLLHARNGMIVVRYRACLNAKEKLSFFAYILLPFIAEGVQVPLYGVALMNTAIALATLVVFMNIQASHRAELAERERELAEARGDIMLSQIQPHFLYNTLTAIRELCLTNPEEAAQTVTGFARYLRENMASLTSKDPVPFERELDHVRTYADLERRRFGDRLSVEYDIQTVDFRCPPLVVQPLVENAVRHGVMKRAEGGTVCIQTREDRDAYVVAVVDDGVGCDEGALEGRGPAAPSVPGELESDGAPSAAARRGGSCRARETTHQARRGAGPSEHQHVGIRNVRLRLREVCDATLDIRSAPGRGTVAEIRIPKRKERELS